MTSPNTIKKKNKQTPYQWITQSSQGFPNQAETDEKGSYEKRYVKVKHTTAII